VRRGQRLRRHALELLDELVHALELEAASAEDPCDRASRPADDERRIRSRWVEDGDELPDGQAGARQVFRARRATVQVCPQQREPLITVIDGDNTSTLSLATRVGSILLLRLRHPLFCRCFQSG
jgi:hypothetical protein